MDDYFILWVKGGETLSVISRRQFSPVNTIKDFFVFKGESTRPISGCAFRDASKIFALSAVLSNNRQIAHYYEAGPKFERLKVRPLSKIFPEFKKAFTVEVSKQEDIFFVAGISKSRNKPMVISAEFNQGLNLISYLFLDFLEPKDNIRIKRIKGYELLILACGRSIVILEFSDYKFEIVA